MGARFWKLILLRATWFLLAGVCLVLGLLIAAQYVAGGESGTNYPATVTAKAPIAGAGPGEALCRVTVDPAGAPEESDAPTRIRSTTACGSLPAVGAPVQLTWTSDGRTLVAGDVTPLSQRTPLWVAGILGVALLAFLALFVRTSRAFKAALEEADEPGAPGEPGGKAAS
ncbi:hypothetical protein N864_06720 [Intrasporangium chromatireducens Q5-1]|uniref:Uncharacterized protein n=1 Tax=Intrasporangium chromatireducens Q5-1 TaxID=584657 RepID=W9GDB8_9MICO|nr:hypothetical protein [Intrasporangium chromatireducens]EWT04035.1 hypothetical protein N864_06720 [Intrasporangium chromatireducens Q5-1]